MQLEITKALRSPEDLMANHRHWRLLPVNTVTMKATPYQRFYRILKSQCPKST